MADKKATRQAVLDESVRRELEKRGLLKRAAQAPQADPGIITSLQNDAKFIMGQFASPDYWRSFELPGIGSLNLEQIANIQSAVTGAPNLLSPAGRLLINRAYQGINPFAAGEVGNTALESNPEMLRGARELSEAVGDTPAAALQFGSQLLPGVVLDAGAGALAGASSQAPRAYTALRQAVPEVGKRVLKAGATSAGVGAGQEALGAREGDRLDALRRGLTNPLYWALGAAPASAAAIGDIRAGNAAALADIRQPRVDEASARVRTMLEDERRVADINQARAQVDAWQARIAENIKALQEQEQLSQARRDPSTIPEIAAVREMEVRQGLDTLLPEASPPTVQRDIPGWLIREMPWDDRARMISQRADQMSAELPTIVDPDILALVRAKTTPRGGAETQVGAIDSSMALPERVRTPGSSDMPEKIFTQTPLSAQEALRLSVPDLDGPVTPLSPEATAALPSTLESKTQVGAIQTGFDREFGRPIPLYEFVDPKSKKVYEVKAEIQNDKPGTLFIHRIGEKGVDARTFGEVHEAAKNQVGPAVMRQIINDLKRTTGATRVVGYRSTGMKPDMLADFGRMTQPIQIPDIAKIQGTTPEAVVARGGGGPVGKNIGEPTQVLSQEQIRGEQNAKADPRTVESPRDTPIPPGGLPKDVDVPGAAMTDAAYAASKMQEARNPSILQELAKKAQLPENRAVPIVSAAIRGFKAAEHIHNVMMERLFPRLNKVVKAMSPEERKLTKMFIEQNLSPLKEGPSIPVEALPREFRELFQQGMEQNSAYRNDLIKAGYFSPEQIKSMERLVKQGYQWLHRDYRAFMDKGYVPDRALLDRAIRWTVAKAKGKLTYGEAANELINLMNGSGDVNQRFRQSRLNKEILKARSQIPPIIRDVLGEIKDPAYVVANSMGEIERLWRQHKVSQAFTDKDYKGIVWDDKPNKNMAPERIWNENMSEFENKRTYGEFAGKYVAPQLHESIMQGSAPVVRSTLQNILAWMSGAFKTAKVLGAFPTAYTNNWVSNGTYAAAAGLPIWNARWAPRMKQSAQAILSFGDAFTTPRAKGSTSPIKGDAAWVQWALEDGAIIPGIGSEVGGASSRRIASELLDAPRDGFTGYLDKTWKLWRGLKNKGGSLYEALDNHWRLAVYIEQVTKGRERLGLPIADARARASRIVNENFASAGSVGKLVRETSDMAGWMAPFMTWHADNIRVHYNWLKNSGRGLGSWSGAGTPLEQGARMSLNKGDILSGEGSGQALNVALHYGLIGGLFEGLRRLYNWSDQETAVAEASLKSGYKTNNPGPVRQWLPWRDSKGRAQVISLVPLMPSAMFLKGNPKESLLSRAFQATALGFVQGGAAEDPTRRALSMLGMGEDEFKPEVLPGQEGRAMLEAAWNYIEPGLVRDVRNALRRTETAGQRRRFEETYTPGQAAAAFTPLKIEPAGRQSQESERRREVAQSRETSGDMRQVSRLAESPATKAELRRAVRKELLKRAKERSQRSKDIRGGR